MQKRVLMLTTSAFILACGAVAASAQQGRMTQQQPQNPQQQQGQEHHSLQEFQAAHERIFKAMDANKDGVLTMEEIQAFMQGTRTSVPRQ
jgi:uncharacterized membrane protein YebE (DUF533 family)